MTRLTMLELLEAEGHDLGSTDWQTIDQSQVDLFAEATGDHQWIHVDPVRAAGGPFGTTIAHGYLSLSLLPSLLDPLIQVSDAQIVLNYGIDRVRFTAPVPVGSSVRLNAKLLSAEQRANGVLYRINAEVEVEGEQRPALIGEVLFLAVP